MLIDGRKVLYSVKAKKLVYPEIPTEGLVCYFDARGKTNNDKHKGTLIDLSGNGNHGTLQNFSFTEESGYVKDLSSGTSGLSFDGVDDRLNFVRLTNATPYTYKVNFILTSTAKEQNALIQFGYGAYVHSATDTLFLPWSNSTAQGTILKNEKYEIVTASDGTYDGTDVYVNGEKKTIYRVQSDNFSSTSSISVGKKIIENIMLWNRKLTEQEIQQLTA